MLWGAGFPICLITGQVGNLPPQWSIQFLGHFFRIKQADMPNVVTSAKVGFVRTAILASDASATFFAKEGNDNASHMGKANVPGSGRFGDPPELCRCFRWTA